MKHPGEVFFKADWTKNAKAFIVQVRFHDQQFIEAMDLKRYRQFVNDNEKEIRLNNLTMRIPIGEPRTAICNYFKNVLTSFERFGHTRVLFGANRI